MRSLTIECDECGRNDVVGQIGDMHYCTRHEAAVTDRHRRDLVDWSDATAYELIMGHDN